MLPSNMNLIQMIAMMRKSGNPQQFMIQMLEQQNPNSPFMNNLISLAKNNDGQGIEQIARNILKEQGRDFDKEFKAFRDNLGL